MAAPYEDIDFVAGAKSDSNKPLQPKQSSTDWNTVARRCKTEVTLPRSYLPCDNTPLVKDTMVHQYGIHVEILRPRSIANPKIHPPTFLAKMLSTMKNVQHNTAIVPLDPNTNWIDFKTPEKVMEVGNNYSHYFKSPTTTTSTKCFFRIRSEFELHLFKKNADIIEWLHTEKMHMHVSYLQCQPTNNTGFLVNSVIREDILPLYDKRIRATIPAKIRYKFDIQVGWIKLYKLSTKVLQIKTLPEADAAVTKALRKSMNHGGTINFYPSLDYAHLQTQKKASNINSQQFV
jgi:hypothetical protein